MMVDDGIWLSALDLKGNIAWQIKAGPFTSKHGYGASPMPWRDLVLVAGDNPETAFLAAVHRRTGKIAWRIDRPDAPNFATPIAGMLATAVPAEGDADDGTNGDEITVEQRPQMVITGPEKVFSYDPNSGELIWFCDGPTDVAACTAVLATDRVYTTAGYPKRRLMCIESDGRGDVTDTHVAWQFEHRREAGYVPSPLLHDGRLYMASDEGLILCFDAATGREIWRHDLGTPVSASPIFAAGRIYLIDESGTTHVFAPGDRFERLAENTLDDPGFATPRFCADRVYLRTAGRLWCFGE
jgi:hypothetical protein